MGDAFFEKVECGGGHDFERGTRLGRAMRDAQCSLMKNDIAAGDQSIHEGAVADIALDDVDLSACDRVGHVFDPAAHHVVDENDFSAVSVDQQVGDVGSDKAATASDQDAFALQARDAASREWGRGIKLHWHGLSRRRWPVFP